MPRKPRQARSLATVDAIIDAGFLCVCRHGLQGATTNHIAAAAGLSTGSAYTSLAFGQQLERLGIAASFGSTGDAFDCESVHCLRVA